MHRFPIARMYKTTFVGLAATMWLCCVLVIGGVLFVLFGWQAEAIDIAAATLVVVLLAWLISSA